jgi:hypothetical protein
MLAEELKPRRQMIERRAKGRLRLRARCDQAAEEQGEQCEDAPG